MTLLRELIDIPEAVHKGDFVLRLTEGIDDPAGTVRTYVVTPQLAGAFDHALRLVGSAIGERTSKAAFLHGSFGSGKSHFMAVLYGLLAHEPAARAIPELAGAVDANDAALAGSDILLLAYHMIGQRSLEGAVFSGYVKHCQAHHPDAPIPPLYRADPIFANATALRETMGDDKFFAELGGGTGGDAGFGALGAGWDAGSYDAAVAAAPDDPERLRLVSDIVATILPAFAEVAGSGAEAYVEMDEGLAIISDHARKLGYDAVVLFLDELILWLASRIADLGWVEQEVHKVVKLVEATSGARPVPIVSFIARQRDLRELVGEAVPGAETLGFTDVLHHWEGRFDTITLEDRNLAKIAQKRLLAPRDDAARVRLEAGYDELLRSGTATVDALCAGAGRDALREVYPFTPAFVDAVVSVSAALQRERTALRLMLMHLVNHRDELAVGDVVPVGDLWDLIADGEEPFTEALRRHFGHAKALYYDKLLPTIEDIHGLGIDDYDALAPDDPAKAAMRADLRLVHTLLVAAMTPEAATLKDLTAADLVALNHGTFRSPIPGQEAADVLAKLRRIGTGVGELHLDGDDANPTVSLRLSGVDTATIVEKGRHFDNPANRLLLLRRMLAADLGFSGGDSFETLTLTWRGTRRSVDVQFGNVRDRESLSDGDLRASGDRWKVVVDLPLDPDPGAGGAAADLARLDEYRAGNDAQHTLCWLPSLLSAGAQRDLGALVVVDHILTGDRFDDLSTHLAPQDRPDARVMLDNNRNQLRARIRNALEAAYGIRPATDGAVDEAHRVGEHFQSLWPGFEPRPPAAATLAAAFEAVVHQALAAQYPAHPEFGTDITRPKCDKVLDVVRAAIADPDGRATTERDLRPLVRAVAQPLGLGTQHETAFVLSRHRFDHLDRRRGEAGGTATVADLRRWLDEPEPAGLPAEAANVVILAYAAAANLSFRLHGGPAAATVSSIDDDCELVGQTLPPETDWKAAGERAGAVFGVAASPLLNAQNVQKLAAGLRDKAAEGGDAVRRYAGTLARVCGEFGVADDAPRLQTTLAAVAAVGAAVAAGDDDAVVAALAHADLGGRPLPAIGRSVATATENLDTLERASWDVFTGALALADERAEAAAALGKVLRETLAADELAVALAPKLAAIQADCVKVLATQPPPPQPPPPPPSIVYEPPQPNVPPKLTPPDKPGWTVVHTGNVEGIGLGGFDTAIDGLRSRLGDRSRIDITWTISEPEDGS